MEEYTDTASASKLTNWTNEPSVMDLKQNIDDAEADHSMHNSKVSGWIDSRDMTGRYKPKKTLGKSSVAPKVIRKQNEWRYTGLSEPFLNSPNLFNVLPVTAGDRLRAQQNALILNKQFNNDIGKVKLINAFIREVVDTGTVILKVGWYTEEADITEEVITYNMLPTDDEEVGKQYQGLLQIKQESTDLFEQYMNDGIKQALDIFMQSGQLVIPQEASKEMVTSKREIRNQPTVEVCIGSNIIIDPSCNGDINKAGFIGERFKTSLSELKKDGRYKNLDKFVISGADPIANPDYSDGADVSSFAFTDEPRKQFVVTTYWGTWDIHSTGIAEPIAAYWVNDTMIRLEKNPYPDKRPPFCMAVYMPVRHSIFGEPDAELLLENQQIIGAVTRGVVDLMGKSANGQTGTRQGFLSLSNLRKFRLGDDYEYQQGNPMESVFQHKYPEIPQSAYNMLTMQNAEAESFTGVKAFSNGINGASLGNSVGGGRDAMDAASKREVDILRRLAACIVEAGRKIIAMNAEFLSEEEVVRITDEKFITVRRDDLAGNFDLELTISTAEEDQKKAEELAFMLQTTGNNMDAGLRNMILSDIARLRQMPELAKRIENYTPEPDPIEIKMKELQLALVEAQIAKENALTAKHSSEAGVNQTRAVKEGTQADLNSAKAQVEQAKGRNFHSDSNKKDAELDDLQHGVTHARELQKMDMQANSALEKSIVESSLKDKATKQ